MTTKADLRAQIRDLLEEREELLTVIRRLQRGSHPAGRALRVVDEAAWRDLQVALTERDTDLRPHIAQINADAAALAEALTERDAEHEGDEGA